MKKRTSSILVPLLALVGATGAYAGNITIADNTPVANGFGTNAQKNSGQGGEDNETERNNLPGYTQTAVASQVWDMEAFLLNAGKLKMVGGYDLQNGRDGYTTGDIFISLNGPVGYYPIDEPVNNVAETVLNSAYYNYDFVIDLSYAGQGNEGFSGNSGNFSVYATPGTALFETVKYDEFFSNPWRYASGGSAVSGGADFTYATGKTDAQTRAAVGDAGTTQFYGGSHNVLSIDMQWLVDYADANSIDLDNIYFSYTMECGNDSLKGLSTSSPDIRVPDNASSLLLASMGLLGLGLLARRRKA